MIPLLPDVLGGGIAGFLSAIIMTLMEYPFWRRWGMELVVEWQVNWVMLVMLHKKWNSLSNPIRSWTIASHISHGIAAGIVFRLLLPALATWIPFLKVSLILDAAAYGVLLWLLFNVLARQTFESAGGIKITNRGLLASLFSDLVYGISLGILLPLTTL
jgi:hypothetical protein